MESAQPLYPLSGTALRSWLGTHEALAPPCLFSLVRHSPKGLLYSHQRSQHPWVSGNGSDTLVPPFTAAFLLFSWEMQGASQHS